MKKILFISAFPPNQRTAGQDYTRRLIIDLLEKGYTISLIYAEYPGHEIDVPQNVNILKSFKPSLLNCLAKISYHPFFTKRLSLDILNLLLEISHNYDVLYFDFSQMHIYSTFINHPCKILMCHDVIAQKYTRSHKEQLYWIKKSESKCLLSASLIITFSEKDNSFIKNTYDIDSKSVNFYLKNPKFIYENKSIQDNTFCFYGAWNRPENKECLEWFFRNVFPNLNKDINFIIIGGGMSEKLKKQFMEYNNISCLGFVDNPVLEISYCQALIAPLMKGAGVKVKVIDALTCGTTVIGTDVAFEGIKDNKVNNLFKLKNKPEEYIDLLNNWKKVTVDYKQKAANEFFENYNKNHFTDLLLIIQ